MSEREIPIDAYIPGDILTFPGDLDHYRVAKVWQSQDGEGYRWSDYDLIGRKDGRQLCLSVERDDGEWIAALYDTRPLPEELPGAAELPAALSYAGVSYRREERGRARIALLAAEGLAGGEPPLNYRYADYEGPSGRLLAVEIYGGGDGSDPEVEIYVGRELPVSQVQLFGIAPRPAAPAAPAKAPAAGLPPALLIGAAVAVALILIILLAVVL